MERKVPYARLLLSTKLNDMNAWARKNWSIIVIIAITPILLWVTIPILPTFDDWSATTSPDFKPLLAKEHFLFYGFHWRPFDALTGYIVGKNPQLLYPLFNHCCVVLGHAVSTLLVLRLLTILKIGSTSRNIATVFFFITPATMATVLAVDSINQTYALLLNLIAFLCYISLEHWKKYVVWTIFIFLSTLFKENGLMWALICPILAYGFNFVDYHTLKKDLIAGIGIMVLYALAVILLPHDITIYPDYVPDNMKIIKNIVKFIFSSFVTVDYIYLLHQPNRNLLFAAITLLIAIPFLYQVINNDIKIYRQKRIWCTVICLFIAVAPHILTVFSMMHAYAGLALVAILIAIAFERQSSKWSFVLFFTVAVAIDFHLWHESLKSGLVGKEMAMKAIQKTGKPVKNVRVIIIDDDYPKLSSFCVIPYEAFGWGLAAQYETNYKWPDIVQDTTIERSVTAVADAYTLGYKLLDKRLCDCVWIVDHKDIEVIR